MTVSDVCVLLSVCTHLNFVSTIFFSVSYFYITHHGTTRRRVVAVRFGILRSQLHAVVTKCLMPYWLVLNLWLCRLFKPRLLLGLNIDLNIAISKCVSTVVVRRRAEWWRVRWRRPHTLSLIAIAFRRLRSTCPSSGLDCIGGCIVIYEVAAPPVVLLDGLLVYVKYMNGNIISWSGALVGWVTIYFTRKRRENRCTPNVIYIRLHAIISYSTYVQIYFYFISL